MARPSRLIFLSLGLFLLLFPLAVGRPGVPVTLKADEPAYLLAALSLVEDGDLLCERHDIERLVDRFPYLPIENLIVMSQDNWETVHFGKPYLYSLLAAPAAAVADHRGMVAFNMLLLLGMIWMGAVYLRRFNPEWLATLFAAAFFLLSAAFAYVFWLQPEILNMFSVTACLFFALHRFEPTPPVGPGKIRWALFNPRTAPAWSGGLLTIAVYHKPMLAVMGLAALAAVWRHRGWKQAAVWLLTATLATGAIIGGSYALTDQAIAYLGASRLGVKVDDPDRYEELVASFRVITRAVVQKHGEETVHSYSWLASIPDLFPRMLLENLGYFLWGRHTGLFIYLPFSALCLLYFLLRPPRRIEKWLLLASMAALGLFFLIWIHYNWHGGAGFVGNRYFINAYPGFLFLVTVIAPTWLVVPAFAAAGLFLAPILFTPFGAPVPRPTLQAHTRGAAFRLLPVELSLRGLIPGYESLTAAGMVIDARQDLFRVVDRAGARFQVWGAATSELWISSAEPVSSLLLLVSTVRPDNEIRLILGQARQRLVYRGEADDGPRLVELVPGGATRVRSQWGKTRYAYRLLVTARSGVNPRRDDGAVREPQFYVGAEIVLLGSRDELERASHYRIRWRNAQGPEAPVAPGESFSVSAVVVNESDVEWRSTGPLPVRLSWHWLDDRDQRPVVYEGLRTPLASPLAPGERRRVELEVVAPERPGSYVLVLDAVREQIDWFSRLGAPTHHLPIGVSAPQVEGE